MATKTRLPGSTSGARREGRKAPKKRSQVHLSKLAGLGHTSRINLRRNWQLAFQVATGCKGILADPQAQLSP